LKKDISTNGAWNADHMLTTQTYVS
jgi:hypothetical protein